MDTELLLTVISRWAHVGTAIVLVGGTAFYRLAVIPSLEGDSTELVERIRNRWKKVVHLGILIFLISGFYNYFTMIPKHKGDGPYHALLGVKMMLAMFVFFVASVLAGNRPGTQMFRDDAKKWTGIMLMVAAVIVGISGFVKVRPIPAAAAVAQPSE
ncbi:MAG TPA: hypothetical protein EYG03_22700 [Planctomycetes bacterium]|nr:hypothetical protein [Fuerstiella sp.]HIK94765.1 hypothetical protein [Planctomycetota bacterium]